MTDKLLNGIAIAIIQVISPCSDGKTKDECHDEFGPFFGRMMIVFTVLSIIITVSDHYQSVFPLNFNVTKVTGNFQCITLFQITLPRFADYTDNMEADSKDCERQDSERRPLMH